MALKQICEDQVQTESGCEIKPIMAHGNERFQNYPWVDQATLNLEERSMVVVKDEKKSKNQNNDRMCIAMCDWTQQKRITRTKSRQIVEKIFIPLRLQQWIVNLKQSVVKIERQKV